MYRCKTLKTDKFNLEHPSFLRCDAVLIGDKFLAFQTIEVPPSSGPTSPMQIYILEDSNLQTYRCLTFKSAKILPWSSQHFKTEECQIRTLFTAVISHSSAVLFLLAHITPVRLPSRKLQTTKGNWLLFQLTTVGCHFLSAHLLYSRTPMSPNPKTKR